MIFGRFHGLFITYNDILGKYVDILVLSGVKCSIYRVLK